MKTENKIKLVGFYGSDKTHALAAWSSTFMELNIKMPTKIEDRVGAIVDHILKKQRRKKNVKNLLKFLGDNKHTSPFRFSFFHFVSVKDIATHIQFLKHSVAMLADNAESARYKELMEDKFYIPKEFYNVTSQSGLTWAQELINHTEIGNKLYHECLKSMSSKFGRSRAKETARYFKGYNSQINGNQAFSFDGLLQFYFKRNEASPSQREIAHLAESMINQVRELKVFDNSLKAFGL